MALWKFTKAMWLYRNQLIHGVSEEETAARLLNQLHEEIRHHYSLFTADNSYVLPRHSYLLLQRTLTQRLTMSYDYLKC
jgi:hypothetical protein